ncbi:MAG: transglutaminase-like domain-containing protein [Saccharofermentans sp.]|nr:transglutaminase-like domain-containing protein [Saccharofermentans sp.]
MSRSKVHKTVLTVFIIIAILMGSGAGVFAFDYAYKQHEKIKKEVVIEAGSPITLDLFFYEMLPNSSFVTDVSLIDTSVPAIYSITVKGWKFTSDVILTIQDTTAPTGEPVSQIIYADKLPDPQQCVKSVMDLSPVTVSYADANPNVHEGGQYDVPVSIMDAYGNETIIDVPFLVIDDHTPPTIYGTHDMEYWVGDTIQYREGIAVADDYTVNPTFTIDNSAVNPDVGGDYPVIYSAVDGAGNQTDITVNLTLVEKPDDFDDMMIVYDLALEVLNEITEPDMTDVEKAFRIFYWARYNIHYIGTSDKSTWVNCALEGFTTYRGDCYTYFACCHALLDVAGIDNVMVERYPAYNSHHYWNLVYLEGQWYHCDSCPSSSHDGYYFMYTDAELGTGNRFESDSDKYPARATESVQRRLNYNTFEMREE